MKLIKHIEAFMLSLEKDFTYKKFDLELIRDQHFISTVRSTVYMSKTEAVCVDQDISDPNIVRIEIIGAYDYIGLNSSTNIKWRKLICRYDLLLAHSYYPQINALVEHISSENS